MNKVMQNSKMQKMSPFSQLFSCQMAHSIISPNLYHSYSKNWYVVYTFRFNSYIAGCTIRNTTLKVVIGDILEQNTEGIVNSVNDEFEFLGNVLLVCK